MDVSFIVKGSPKSQCQSVIGNPFPTDKSAKSVVTPKQFELLAKSAVGDGLI